MRKTVKLTHICVVHFDADASVKSIHDMDVDLWKATNVIFKEVVGRRSASRNSTLEFSNDEADF